MDINEKPLFERVDEMSWMSNGIPVVHKDYCNDIVKELESVRAERNALQAQVDALMLKYCPLEMTIDQKAKWATSQRTVRLSDDGDGDDWVDWD